jgi:hypothetical protein
MSSTRSQEEGTRLSAEPRKWTCVSTNHHTKNRNSVGDPQKSDITTNNHFEVLSNLNGSTDYNPIKVGKKFYPTTSSRSNSIYIKASKAKHNDKELPSNKHSCDRR